MKYKIGDKVRVEVFNNGIFSIISISQHLNKYGYFYEIQKGIFLHEDYLKSFNCIDIEKACEYFRKKEYSETFIDNFRKAMEE